MEKCLFCDNPTTNKVGKDAVCSNCCVEIYKAAKDEIEALEALSE